MNSYNIDVNINGKLTIEVMAENEKQAKQMVDDILQNSTFKDVISQSRNNVSLDLKTRDKNKEMER